MWVQLDSIKVINHSKGVDTVLHWPDTLLMLEYHSGLAEGKYDIEKLIVFQNFPNPVIDQTTISLYIPDKDEVGIVITDALGRIIIQEDRVLKKGYHAFWFKPCDGSLFFFTAKWRGNVSSIKILQAIQGNNTAASLEYAGSTQDAHQLKVDKAKRGGFEFTLGDELLCIGNMDTLQSGILDTPEENITFTFQFATNIPCPGTPEVFYEGQVYHTVQIYSQCWLKENLNVGKRIDGIMYQTNNDTIEKYCYDNDTSNCDKYGGLYQWDEMMKYTTQPGAQGICPEGWHIPTDEEWKLLEGAVDSQYGFHDPEWDMEADYRGFDVGERLKSQNSWSDNGNGSDIVGFSALATGCRRYLDGVFLSMGIYTSFWSSVQTNQGKSWYRYLVLEDDGISRYSRVQSMGRSVRCIRDD